MRTLLKLLQHNIWYKVIVSLKKWHYEKKFTYYCFFPPYTTFFFLEIYFFKNEFIQSQNKQKKICYCVCKYLSMLFLVISTKKRFQKSNCKRKDPEWVYGTRGQKKPNRQKKSPVLYNKTQQKNMWSILHVELRKKEISLTYFIPRFAYFMQHFVIIFCV